MTNKRTINEKDNRGSRDRRASRTSGDRLSQF